MSWSLIRRVLTVALIVAMLGWVVAPRGLGSAAAAPMPGTSTSGRAIAPDTWGPLFYSCLNTEANAGNDINAIVWGVAQCAGVPFAVAWDFVVYVVCGADTLHELSYCNQSSG